MPPQQDMTYSPAYDQTQNQIIAAIRSSNPPHPSPSISPPLQPSPVHLPKQPVSTATQERRSLRASQTSTVTTDRPGSVSRSSSGSYAFPKSAVVDTGRSSFEQQQQIQQQHQRLQQQQATFFHNQGRTSGQGNRHDGHRDSRGEKYRRSGVEAWSSPRSTSGGSPHRTHYRISAFPGDEEDQDDDLSDDPEENAFIILLKLSFFVPPYSVLAALYAFFALLFTTLLCPLRLLPKSTPFSPSTSYTTQLISLLAPPLHVHKSLISSHQLTSSHDNTSFSTNPYSYPSRLSGDSPSSPRNTSHPLSTLPPPAATMYSLPTVVLIHLLSPVLSIGILLASWTAAFFWVFAIIIGNPDGTERRDDGRAAVLGVRNWWRAWLRKGG